MKITLLTLLLTGCFIGGDPFTSAPPDPTPDAALLDAAVTAPPRLILRLHELPDASAPAPAPVADASPDAAPDVSDPGCLPSWEMPCTTDAGRTGCAPYGDVNPGDCHEKVSSDR